MSTKKKTTKAKTKAAPDDVLTKEQDIFFDDFLESLKQDGIEYTEPDQDPEDLPQGIGADSGSFSPRLTAPAWNNPYYIHRDGGGYNLCIKISGNDVLPNCVGYAYGRYLEEAGITAENNLPRCNAEDWLSMAKAYGFPTGTEPRVGAVVVWKRGQLWNSKDGCGHVAVVEKVNADRSIVVSFSNYGGTRFVVSTIPAPYGITGQQFIGFIYNPHIVDVNPEPAQKTITEIARQVIAGKWGNGEARKQALTAAGYSYAAVQAEVNRLLAGGSDPEPVDNQIRIGDTVTVKKAINYDTGRTFSVWYRTYKVMELNGKRAVIGVNGIITSAISVDNLSKA